MDPRTMQAHGKLDYEMTDTTACATLTVDGPEGPVIVKACVPLATVERAIKLYQASHGLPAPTPAQLTPAVHGLAKNMACGRLMGVVPPGVVQAAALTELVARRARGDQWVPEPGESQMPPEAMHAAPIPGMPPGEMPPGAAIPGVHGVEYIPARFTSMIGPEGDDAAGDDFAGLWHHTSRKAMQAAQNDPAGQSWMEAKPDTMGFAPLIFLAAKYGPNAAKYAAKNPKTMVAAGKLAAQASSGDPSALQHLHHVKTLAHYGHPGAKETLAAVTMASAVQKKAKEAPAIPAATRHPGQVMTSRPHGWSLRKAS